MTNKNSNEILNTKITVCKGGAMVGGGLLGYGLGFAAFGIPVIGPIIRGLIIGDGIYWGNEIVKNSVNDAEKEETIKANKKFI